VSAVDIEISPRPWSPPKEEGKLISSRLSISGRLSLKKPTEAEQAALEETLNRVLPSPEIPQVPVAAFNSTI
jgi:FXSXX-COOH protein